MASVIDFPNSPAVGQLFTPISTTFKWDGVAWVAQPLPGTFTANIWVGDAPPADTTRFPLWWSTLTLQLSIWYDDGNSKQWVSANSTPSGAPDAPKDGTQYARKDGQWSAIVPATLASLGIANHDKLTVNAAGNLVIPGTVQALGVGDVPTLYVRKPTASGEAAVYGFSQTVPHWRIMLSDTNGDFAVTAFNDGGNFVGSPLQIFRATRKVTLGGDGTEVVFCPQGHAGGGSFIATAAEHAIQIYGNPSYRLGVRISDGLVSLITNGNVRSNWDISNNFTHVGQAWKPGGGIWADTSDERIKERIEDYVTGLDAVLALRPRTYHFREATGRDTSIKYVGLIAQEAEGPMPEMVTSGPRAVGEIEHADMRALDSSALIFALVNAVKTLHARLAALEAAR